MAEQTTPYAPSPMTVSTRYFDPTLNLTLLGSAAAFLEGVAWVEVVVLLPAWA